jgi:hypothetical protein
MPIHPKTKIDAPGISLYFCDPKIETFGGISKPKTMHPGHRQTKIDVPNQIWCIDFLDFRDFLAPGALIFGSTSRSEIAKNILVH